MKLQSASHKIQKVKLTKTVGKKKQEDVRKFNMMEIKEADISGNSVKPVKKIKTNMDKPKVCHKGSN